MHTTSNTNVSSLTAKEYNLRHTDHKRSRLVHPVLSRLPKLHLNGSKTSGKYNCTRRCFRMRELSGSNLGQDEIIRGFLNSFTQLPV